MTTIKLASGKTIPLIHVIIYVRQSLKNCLQFMDEEKQNYEMAKFNRSVLTDWNMNTQLGKLL